MKKSIDDLASRIAPLKPRGATKLIAIDGLGGSGKSVLADQLAKRLAAGVVRMDDFYLPSDERLEEFEHFDFERLLEDVLKPLMFGDVARYQRYDWRTDRLTDWIELLPGGIAIVEGVYSTRPELRSFYDLRVWVDCDREIRLHRGLARDGEHARDRWLNDWMPREDRYVQRYQPRESTDVVIENSTED